MVFLKKCATTHVRFSRIKKKYCPHASTSLLKSFFHFDTHIDIILNMLTVLTYSAVNNYKLKPIFRFFIILKQNLTKCIFI